MQSAMSPLLLVLSALLLHGGEAHVYKLGECPQVDVQKDFDVDRYMGRWYVIQRFSTSSSCIVETLFKNNTKYFLSEKIEPLGMSFTQRGEIAFPSRDTQAVMKVAFPISRALGPQNYWVMMTDYDSYAAVWSCQKILFGHRQSAQIMSRTPTLSLEVVRKIRRRFESFGINEHEFSLVRQDDCDREAEERDSASAVADNNRIVFKIGSWKFTTAR